MNQKIKTDTLKKDEFFVCDIPLQTGQEFIKEHHYAKGGSNTAVYMHGLFRLEDETLMGVAWWLPPTRVAAESVNKEQWQKVLSLTRMAVHPEAPRYSCSFLLSRSIKLIKKDNRFVSLVTYADFKHGHDGLVYKASNWKYVGETGPYPSWEDSEGRQVAPKATKNRTKAEMEALGYVKVGSFKKHKYVYHLDGSHLR